MGVIMKCILYVTTALLFVSTSVIAQIPSLADAYQVKLIDGSIMDVQGIGHAAPVYSDVDGDSVPDMLVGEFKDGACRIYKNYGSAHAPIFKDFTFLKTNGVQATVPPS